MGHVIAVSMQKGGVGKTTTTLNVGSALAARGARVLFIDMDPQANLTQGLGVNPDSVDLSVYEVLVNAADNHKHGVTREVVSLHPVRTMDLVPSTLDLSGAEMELAGRTFRELLLKTALTEARTQYDYVLIDTPPSLGVLTVNALVASDTLVVPLQMETYAFKALPQLEKTLAIVRQLNPSIEIGAMICSMVTRTNLARDVEKRLRKQYGDVVLETVVYRAIAVAEAPAFGESIASYAPASSAAAAYELVTNELEARFAWR